MASLSLKGAQLLVRLPQISSTAIQHCNYSSEVRAPRELNTAAMKRGRGGRSSFSGDVVTIFGASGFIGTCIANRFGKNGSQLIFPYRGDHYKMMRLKVVGDLGQVLFSPFELKDEDSIRRAISHSNIVVNMIGRNIETSNYKFADVHIKGPQLIARLCKEAGVKRLVHMSHINAREKPEEVFLKGGSEFLASKYQGELAVRAEFPEATIFRPSDVYGPKDNFINHWFAGCRWGRKRFDPYRVYKRPRGVALYGKGELTVKQPIWYRDLATGIMNSLYDPAAIGQTYEAVGPERVIQADLLRYMYEIANWREDNNAFDGFHELLFAPYTLGRAWALNKFGLGNLLWYHQQSLERLERDSLSDMSEGYPNMAEALGVKLHTLALKMPYEVIPLDQYSYYQYEQPEDLPKTPVYRTINAVEERQIQERRNDGVAFTLARELPVVGALL